jgi:hypothetical protein
VQHRGDADERAEALRVAGDVEQGRGHRLEQQREQALAVVRDQRAELGGQREDDVEVRDGQRPLHARLHPACLSQRLALRAVTVAAGIVSGAHDAAAWAHVEVSAENGGATD